MKDDTKAVNQKLDINFYRNTNPDLTLLTDEQATAHWINFGSLEGRIPNSKRLHLEWEQNNLPKNFDYEEYLYLNPDLTFASELQCKVHYLSKGRLEFRPTSFTQFPLQEYLLNFLKELSFFNDVNLSGKFNFSQIKQLNNLINQIEYLDLSQNKVDKQFFIDFYFHRLKIVPSPSRLRLVMNLYNQIFSKTESKKISVLKSIIQVEFLESHKLELARKKSNLDKAFQAIGDPFVYSMTELSNRFAKIKKKNYVPIYLFFRLVELFLITKNFLMLKILRRKPKVTLICSLYNGDKFIEKFIRNLCSLHKFYRCELIIVDACSPGNEYEFLSKFVKYFSNIKFIKMSERIGIYDAWNFAISQGVAPFISNVNVDDLRTYSSISKQMRVLNSNNKIDIVFSNFFYSLSENSSPWAVKRIGIKSKLPSVSTHNLLDFNSPHCAPMWRRTLHDQLGLFDTQFQSAGDWEFWLRCAKNHKFFGKIKKPLAIYFLNPDGLSTSSISKDAEEQIIIRIRYIDLIQNDEKLISEDV